MIRELKEVELNIVTGGTYKDYNGEGGDDSIGITSHTFTNSTAFSLKNDLLLGGNSGGSGGEDGVGFL